MELVDEAYDADGCVLAYFKHPGGEYGDTLARFVALECLDVTLGETNKAAAMVHAMDTAITQLTRVRDALHNVADKS
jgi:hypothetical protein